MMSVRFAPASSYCLSIPEFASLALDSSAAPVQASVLRTGSADDAISFTAEAKHYAKESQFAPESVRSRTRRIRPTGVLDVV
jgi:hypothetical protein